MNIQKIVTGSVVLGLFFSPLSFIPEAHAAVADWQRSASVMPSSDSEFGSDGMKESLRNLKADGATHVNLVITYYQSNTGSTDIRRGFNTPSDASLISAIQYAHSIGLKVSLSMYLETDTSAWRAYINPGDRDTWYRNYGDLLVRYGQLGQAQGVEEFILGAELISMTSTAVNGDNTQRWVGMIARVRAVYGGTLTYSANRGGQSAFGSEITHIDFWDKLDVIGLSAYYSLNGDGSVASLKSAWQNVNDFDVGPIYRKWNKPIIMTEVGYRSVSNAHTQPWDSGMQGPYDPQEQVNDYIAMHEYWKDYPYMQGVILWWWKPNPNAGGNGDTDYTPQNKPSEAVLKSFWQGTGSGGTTSPPQGSVAFSASGSVTPSTVQTGQSVTLTATVTETTGSSSSLVDMEVYNGATKVFQTFQSAQSFSEGQTKNYTFTWTPNAPGTYTFKIGVFANDWSKTYVWKDAAATVQVGSTTQPPASNITDIWWPGDGTKVAGVQPFKALLRGVDVSQYLMYWRVDNGARVPMPTNLTDYPHKESLVDLTMWNWKGAGPYSITFISTDQSGATIGQRSIQIYTK